MSHNTSLEYAVGVICGIIFAIVIAKLIQKLLLKKGKMKEAKFDERQLYEQAKAGKSSLYMLLTYNVVVGVIALYIDGLSTYILMITGAFLAITVYCVLCIWNEAYFGINQRVASWIKYFVIIGVINIAIAISLVFAADGNYLLNLEAGIMCLVIAVTAIIKKKLNEKES